MIFAKLYKNYKLKRFSKIKYHCCGNHPSEVTVD